MTLIALSYDNAVFALKMATGVVLWTGAFLTLPQAKEFARSYISSFQGASCVEEKDLAQKFYDEREKREKKFLYGEKI